MNIKPKARVISLADARLRVPNRRDNYQTAQPIGSSEKRSVFLSGLAVGALLGFCFAVACYVIIADNGDDIRYDKRIGPTPTFRPSYLQGGF